jgi:hypothetical protein
MIDRAAQIALDQPDILHTFHPMTINKIPPAALLVVFLSHVIWWILEKVYPVAIWPSGYIAIDRPIFFLSFCLE